MAFAGQAGAAGAVVHLVVHLRGQHDVLAAGVGLDGSADELLRGAPAVAVGRVPEGDAKLDRLPEERLRRLLVQGPLVKAGIPVTHAAQSDPADFQPGLSESDIVHDRIPSRSW
jgi:hypothetical protein